MEQNELLDNLHHWEYIKPYSEWMYHTYECYLGDTIFEVGAGNGRNVEFYISNRKYVIASDIFQSQIDYMNRRFAAYNYFKAVILNIVENNVDIYKEKFDTVICINVLEHLLDDYKAVDKMKSLLEKGGHLIILVPAFQKIYCQMDTNVNHYRRYNPGRLDDIATKCGMRIVKHHYFNMLGIFPYWLKGKCKLREGESFGISLNKINSKIYNLAAQLLEPIEKRFPPKVGLTEVMILQKL